MKKLFNIKRFSLYFWIALGFLVFGALSDIADKTTPFNKGFANDIWATIYVTLLNYVFFEYTLPKLSRNKIGKSIWLVLVLIFFYSKGGYIWRQLGIGLHIYTPLVASYTLADEMGYSMFSVFFFGGIRHVYNHIKLRQTAQQLRIEKQQAELNYLKSQTNPHFLFNTLNNIYSLARDKSDLAPESIMRLSKMLRYMLYETTGPYVAIEQELKIISDYIELEKLRYDDTLRINFNNDIEDTKQALPPLLLVPLVENAFKHGVSETRNQPFVDIHLSIIKRQLTFLVKNSTGEHMSEKNIQENIGLSNLRRQLELLYTDYNLTVQHNGYVFTATLKINLASHV
jgi:sensor histidine kinase YesM